MRRGPDMGDEPTRAGGQPWSKAASGRGIPGQTLDGKMYRRILCAGGRKTGYAHAMPMTTLQEIIDAARTLSPAERLRLVDAVWDDEHPENWPALSPEWLAEVQRRSA